MADDQDSSIIFQYFNEIGIISQLSSNMFKRNLPWGLTPSQFSVLNWFSRVDQVATPGRLATAFQVTPGAMTNTLKKLQIKGFVEISPDKSSGRNKCVTRTEAGARARDDAIAAAQPVFRQFANQFDTQALATQLELLREVRTYLDELRFK